MSKLSITIGGLLLAVVSFFVYGIGRFMAESAIVGITLRGVCGGIVMLSVVLIPIVLIVLAVCWRKRTTPRYESCLVLALCVVIGALLAEGHLLVHNFRYAKSILDDKGIEVFWDE